jgi:phenol 2-monooxygenase
MEIGTWQQPAGCSALHGHQRRGAQHRGRWRIFAFAAAKDPAAPNSCIRALCDFLTGARESPVRKYTPTGEDIDSVIDVRAIFQQCHRELPLEAMPPFFCPGRDVTDFATTKRCSAPT